ncbi:hypothetical protein [Kribbella sp. CA-247076]|uniref:hypothetical protein n=1 Tax=Kribbella sp. CA-247076 TaxID=3239941 RepID=UPI003D94E005
MSASAGLRAAWKNAHAPVAGVPAAARIAAYTIPLLVLPSSIWRITTVTVFHIGADAESAGDVPSWLPMEVYVVLLSILSELLAFTAIGLIARWGEVVPRWIPGLAGRRIPVPAVVVPGFLGAAALTFLCALVTVTSAVGVDVRGRPLSSDAPLHTDSVHGVLTLVSYLPLLFWGPLLGFVTVAYWRRRTQVLSDAS